MLSLYRFYRKWHGRSHCFCSPLLSLSSPLSLSTLQSSLNNKKYTGHDSDAGPGFIPNTDKVNFLLSSFFDWPHAPWNCTHSLYTRATEVDTGQPCNVSTHTHPIVLASSTLVTAICSVRRSGVVRSSQSDSLRRQVNRSSDQHLITMWSASSPSTDSSNGRYWF